MNRRNNWEQVLGYANEDLKSKGFSIKIKKHSDGYYSCEIRKGRKLVQVYAENYFEDELEELVNDAWAHTNNIAKEPAKKKAAKNAKAKAAATNTATWKDLDWHEKWRIIDHVLAYVGQRVDAEQKTHRDALAKGYDIATEARHSEAGNIIAIIQGMRNSPDVLEKELDKQL